MPDRRRFAAGVPPLLALLAAMLLGWSVAAAQAPDPLTLTLTAERSECTAGTLNPVTWEISGGTPPYTLTIDGEPVDADAESATVICGNLPEGATEAPGTITGTVTDATGAPATASAAYTIVPPLPAPTGLSTGEVNSYHVGLNWDAVEGAGSQSPAVQNDRGRDEFDSYLLRYRDAEAEATAPYEFVGLLQYPFADVRPGPLDALSMPTTTGDYLGMVAAIRHPIEQETPAALHWSAAVPFGVARSAENIVVQATHDTLDVSWDAQPYTQTTGVTLVGGGMHLSHCCLGSGITVADGRYHARFRHLTPDSEYEITIKTGDGADRDAIYSETTARTLPAPADWEPLPRGPQNLRATATHDSITLRWDPPFPEAVPYWFVSVTTAAWPIDRITTGTPPPEGLTLRGLFQPIRPNTTYRVLVRHDGFDASAAEINVTTPAAPPALRLTLAAERAECTAGTLNPVTWEITGGAAPYRLTVDGALVDADAESATVTCGALPDYGSWLPVTQAPGTIRAVVTDAAGAWVSASAAYTIVPPLPAPVATADVDVMRFSVKFAWRALTVPASCDVPTGCFAFRTRLAGDTSWEYSWDEHLNAASDWPPLVYRTVEAAGTTVEAGIASIRDPIEIETPAALDWAATVQATSLTDISGLTATATHDTITVRWNRQPSADSWRVIIDGAEVGGGQSKSIKDSRAGWGDPTSATHEVTFTDLPPDTEFVVAVTNIGVDWEEAVAAGTTIRTSVAPPDHTPRVRGPQNLRATATHDTITVSWDHPWPETEDDYWLGISSSTASVPIRHINARVFPPASQYTYTDLDPSSTYRIVVMHIDVARESAAITMTTSAAPPPLRLTLAAERAECTAATLNPVSWEIEGGGGPYRLTLDGASVDADAESATVTCGALPEGASATPGTITAVVTDATGAPATASAAYTIVPPLPAPRLRPGPMNVEETTIFMGWWPVPGARPASGVGHYLLRWRPAQTSTWRYVTVENQDPPNEWVVGAVWELEGGETYQHQSAAMRDPIEQETPEQLAWTATQTTTTAHPPTGVVATATHDTLTVRWDPQTASDLTWVTVNPHQAGMRPIEHSWRGGDQPADQVTFTGLTPATTYTVTVSVQGDFPEYLSTTIQAETTPAPPGWEPPPRGPQNIRTSATHDSITVRWEHPRPGAPPLYLVLIDDPIGAGSVVEWVHGRTEFTANLLAPNTTYTVEIRHLDIIKAPVTVEVTTTARPATGPSTSPTLTCIEYLVGAVVCT